MLECSYFEDARRVYLPRILTAACNIITFNYIMCTNDVQELFKVAKVCKVILETFKVISLIFKLWSTSVSVLHSWQCWC